MCSVCSSFLAIVNILFLHTALLLHCSFFFLMIPPPPRSTLFPYTTLFRSIRAAAGTIADIVAHQVRDDRWIARIDRKSTRLNYSHRCISYAVFCLKKKRLTYSKRTPSRSKKGRNQHCSSTSTD